MKRKLLFCDSETTGLNAWENGITQIGAIIDIDGQEAERFNFNIKTFPDDVITDGALKVTGITREQIATFRDPYEVWKEMCVILKKYVNPYDRNDEKFIMVGYNVEFDRSMLIGMNSKIEEINPDIEGLFNIFSEPLYTTQNLEWLKAFYVKNGDNYFNSFCRNIIDVRQMYTIYALINNVDINKSTRLSAACEHFGINLDNAHDAMNDIEATKKLYYSLLNALRR